jgi:hypothetical protein
VTAPVESRITATHGHPSPRADRLPSAEGPKAGRGDTPAAGARDGPVIVLSYAYAGADRVQRVLADGAELACTSGTGIIPLCGAAAETWRRVERRPGTAMSPLAAVTIRKLVAAQVTAILASSGQTRWCELATALPSAAEAFIQVFPDARFVCVHRSCPDMVCACVQANPWGQQGHGLTPYLLTYPGNNVAALAAYWANSAEQLMAFESSNREVAHRVRYEDVAAHPDHALAAVRSALGLGNAEQYGAYPAKPDLFSEPDATPAEPPAKVPTEMIPEQLRQHISRLHADLGYPSPEIL